MATSYSHPSRQPGEPHTKTNGTFSLLERANAARCSYTAMCSFTDGVCVCVVGRVFLFKMSLKCTTVQGEKPEGKGATCIS